MALKTVDAVTLRQWMNQGDAVLVDVREPAEHASEHIRGAVLMPLGKLCKSGLPECKGKKLVIHCRKGGRGASACEKLLAEDASLDVYNLEGGIESWAKSGFHVGTSGAHILPLDRQVQLTVGIGLLAASLSGYLWGPAFFLLTGIWGAGLTMAGLTGFCGLARVLAMMPWNQRGVV